MSEKRGIYGGRLEVRNSIVKDTRHTIQSVQYACTTWCIAHMDTVYDDAAASMATPKLHREE